MEDFLRDSPFEESLRTDSENRQFKNEFDPSSTLGDYDFTSAQTYSNQNYDTGAPQHSGDSTTGMPANDPYFEAFDFLGSPTQQPVSPNIAGNNLNPQEAVLDGAFGDSLQFNINNSDALNNLDQLVSPDNGAGGLSGANVFNSSQYFSPNTRTDNFGPLNAIAEDQLSRLFLNNTFSPDLSRHGSVSVAPPLVELYLLPNAFLSPQSGAYDDLFDTLKSPYLGLYLNSPPPLNLSQSTSIPNAPNFNQSSISNALSLPQQYDLHGLGMSAPTLSGNQVRKTAELVTHNKNLTQEEKVKRRREFHNAVERRRRDLIKEKIKELGQLVPPLLLTPQVCAVQTLQKQSYMALKEIKELLASVKVKETKPNKATILLTSVDYISHLQYVLSQQERKRQEIEQQIKQLELGGDSSASRYSSSASRSDQFGALSNSSEFNPDDFFSDVITDRTQF